MVKQTTSIQSSSSQTEYVPDINCNNNNNKNDKNTNTSSSSSCSKYKGVRKRKWGKWVSEIRLPNSRERIWLGSYDSPAKAARAFDAALYCLRGREAKFNFPENPPDIAGGRSLNRSEIQEAAARFAKETETKTAGENNNDDNVGSVIEHETTSSSVEHDDCSFLSTLDISTNDGVVGMSDYGYYSGLDHFSDDQFYFPPHTAEFFAPPPIDDDQNGGDVFSQSSFLWNF